MQGLSLRTFILIGVLSFLWIGCQDGSKTFAGFTYGGGGNTFSCEPAVLKHDGSSFELRAGTPGNETTLLLVGDGPLVPEQLAELSQAKVTVPGHQGETTLLSGHLVPQTQDAAIAHGSFDLKVKDSDGREFNVVGSYTASVETAQ